MHARFYFPLLSQIKTNLRTNIQNEFMSKYTILELFRQEVENHLATVKHCLSALKTQSFSSHEIEQGIQAAHSLWGSASIMDMQSTAELLRIMKECLIVVQKQSISLKDETIDTLFHASELLFKISQVPPDDLERWMTEYSWDWNNTQRAIANLLQQPQITSQIEVNVAQTTIHQDNPEQETAEQNTVKEIPALILPTPPTSTAQTSPGIEIPPGNSGGTPMMDLFRLEAEVQVNILNQGLLSIEDKPQSVQELESLMRAAHSIKGAARIVGLDGVVHLAHTMEDCFVAAQAKTITLTGGDIDILLQGVDLLQSISKLDDRELPIWLGENQANFGNICQQLISILQPETAGHKTNAVITVTQPQLVPEQSLAKNQELSVSSPSDPTSQTPSSQSLSLVPSTQSPMASSQTENKSKNQDRVVRVSADNLNRIMGLAGESLIEANWLQPFADAMMSLKSKMLDNARTLDQFLEGVDQTVDLQQGKNYLVQVKKQQQECLDYIGNRLNELELYVRRTSSLSDRLYREVINSHMRPFEDGLQSFPRMIRDLARRLNKQVKLEIIGKSTSVDRDILSKLEAPLTHILRNAVDHGIEPPEARIAAGKSPQGKISLEAFHRGGMLLINITDDGKGINRENLRQKLVDKDLVTADMATQLSDIELMEFLFLPGFSTAKQVTETSGRGVGLDIAKSMAQEVGGTVRVSSQLGKGTGFHFQLPLTLSVVRTLLVEISGKPYAIPLARIDNVVTIDKSEITYVENREYFAINGHNIGLIPAHQILELPAPKQQNTTVYIVIIIDQGSTYGLVVDKFLGERDLVVKPLDPRLGKLPDISATALLADGSPILIVDVSDLIVSMDTILKGGKLSRVMMQAKLEDSLQGRRILVVDDSITVREMERKILENRGYWVDTAVNGVEGWNAVRTRHYDLVVSDIDMPRMNGIELVKLIKNDPRLNSLPIIIISYRDREEDRVQGLQAGADYYLTKSSFHDESLINAVIDLIGE